MADKYPSGEFPLEKLLTISMADYCESVERKMSEYRAVGVQVNGEVRRDYRGAKFSVARTFANELPLETEVVVGYSASDNGNINPCGDNIDNIFCAQGTALIRRR